MSPDIQEQMRLACLRSPAPASPPLAREVWPQPTFLNKYGSVLAAILLTLVLLLLTGWGIYGLYLLASQEAREWETFRVAHACKIVAHVDGDSFNTMGITSSGKMAVGFGSTSAKDGWLCNDGITYFKSKP